MADEETSTYKPNPWEKREDEPLMWYVRFRRYMDIPGRTLKVAYRRECDRARVKPHSGVPKAWEEMASRWEWRDRADAYDLHCLEEDQAARNLRLQQLKDRAYQIGLKLLEKGESMANFPIATSRMTKDGKQVTIMPTEWVQTDAVKMAEAGLRLAKDGLEVPETTKKSNQQGKTPTTPVGQMELLKELANGPENSPNTAPASPGTE